MAKTAFLFSGQGAQKPGMAQSLFDASPAVRALFATLSEATGHDLAALCFDGTQETLNRTEFTQPAMFAADLAAWAALNERGISADLCAGFSLGEYAALVCAGVLDVCQAGKLVATRARFMAECQGGGMAAVLGAPSETIEAICADVTSGFVAAVNYNCPGQTVIAGESEALAEAIAALKAQKIRAVPLRVSAAFHSKLVMEAADRLFAEASKAEYAFHTPQIPIVLNTTAQPFDEGANHWPTILREQAINPVRWELSVRRLLDLGAERFVECGPGKVLTGFNKRICPDHVTVAVEDADSLAHAASVFG